MLLRLLPDRTPCHDDRMIKFNSYPAKQRTHGHSDFRTSHPPNFISEEGLGMGVKRMTTTGSEETVQLTLNGDCAILEATSKCSVDLERA